MKFHFINGKPVFNQKAKHHLILPLNENIRIRISWFDNLFKINFEKYRNEHKTGANGYCILATSLSPILSDKLPDTVKICKTKHFELKNASYSCIRSPEPYASFEIYKKDASFFDWLIAIHFCKNNILIADVTKKRFHVLSETSNLKKIYKSDSFKDMVEFLKDL